MIWSTGCRQVLLRVSPPAGTRIRVDALPIDGKGKWLPKSLFPRANSPTIELRRQA